MADYGVHAREIATSVSTPVLADVAVPYVVGTAPLHTAESPAKINTPVICTSWDEAVSKLGFSYDWKKYTLCEFMYSHFQLFAQQPVIFCNVLDPEKSKEDVKAKTYPVINHKAYLPIEAMNLDVQVGGAVGSELMSADKASILYEGSFQGMDYKNLMGDDVRILADGHVVGAIPYVKGFTGFSSDTSEQSGHYIVIKFGGEDDVKWKRHGADGTGGTEQTFDDVDHTLILYLDKGIKSAEVTIGEEREGEPFTLDFTQLTLLEDGDELGLAPEEDYAVIYDPDEDACVVELLSGGDHYDDESVTVSYEGVTPGEVEATDIVTGLNAIDLCLSVIGKIPDLIAAPGWSQDTEVSAVMAAKAASINGLFTGKAVIDIDTKEVTTYDQALEYKNKNNLVDPEEILGWPMVSNGGRMFHMSTQLCGLMAQVDSGNGSVPYESPSNKNLKMDACVLEDGTEVNLTFEQANILRDAGISCPLNFMSMGWVDWNSYTACYPANTDVKDYFIPIARMFDYVKTTLIKTFWSKIDKPMTRRLIDNILDTCNIWLNGLTSSGYLLGARAEFLDSENALTDLMAGICHIHVYITPPSPMQECDFVLEYDVNYVQAALAG